MTRSGELWAVCRTHLRVPLFRNAYALILSNIGTTVLGVAFWALAVRYYSAQEVGRASAAISILTMLVGAAALNLNMGLVRFLPDAGVRARFLLLKAYAVAAACAFVVAAIVITLLRGNAFLARLGSAELSFALLFVLGAPLWSVFMLQDSALTGLRAAVIVPIENIFFSVFKIILLIAFAAALPREGILAAWLLAAALLVVPVNSLIFGRVLRRRPATTARVANWGDVRGYLAAEYSGSLLQNLSIAGLPLLVTWQAGLVANAYFYTSWVVVTGLELLIVSVGSALVAEAATNRQNTRSLHRTAFKIVAVLVLPVVAVGVVLAPVLLRVYGPAYADHASTLFRLLVLAAPLRAVVLLRMSVLRVERRGVALMAFQAANGLALGCGSWIVLTHVGITGVGVVYLLTQVALSAAALATARRDRRAPRPGSASRLPLPDPVVSAIQVP